MSSSGTEEDAASGEPQVAVLGIDLGSTCSRVAAYWGEKVQMIKNADGNLDFHAHSPNLIKGLYQGDEELVSTISYIKALAIAQLGGIAISDAVLTVPPNAFDKERQCLKAAAQSAGINILRILNAPISACVGHGLDKLNGEVIYKIVVIDLGAAALRVSMLALEEGIFEIEYHEDGPTLDWNSRLEGSAVGDSADGNDVITKALVFTRETLERAGTTPSDVNFVVVTGGPSTNPQILDYFCLIFNTPPLRLVEGSNDEAIARGASIQGFALKNKPKITQFMCIFDVVPLNIGIEISGGLFHTIIPRNYTVPCKKAQIFTISGDEPRPIKIRIMQGLRKLARDNRFLGEIELSGMAPGSKLNVTIEVVFETNDIIASVLDESRQDQMADKYEIARTVETSTEPADNSDMRKKIQTQLEELREYIDFQLGDQAGQSTSGLGDTELEKMRRIAEWAEGSENSRTLDGVDEKLGEARAIVDGGTDGLPVPCP
ncbi:hypothetical protein CTheo_7426 [Ceratobasidium theobromae]|uniref:Uncharacterized protein n=1 Tax=Ceratobasidium theobromae TaxID=1582974 RepID=A0A5N5QCG5_9AGAM|nr:hypothetical protein CTheo_7426 [Ceratobasidium theobromae]